MHSLPSPRPWLCLSCTAAAARSLPQKIVRPPSSTRAFTSSAVTSSKRHRNRIGNVGQLSRRPFKAFESKDRNPIIGHHNEVADVIRNRLTRTKRDISEPEFLESLALSREDFDIAWLKLESHILRWSQDSADASRLANEDRRGKNTLAAHIRHTFYAQVSDAKFTAAELENQKKVANLCYPAEWFPATREIHRTVHMHVGPTNSGKTYHALKRLENAKSGIYLGPLRLLAHEVFSRLNAKGRPCALITGEEQRIPDDASMFSCTIEMAPLNAFFEVAVIDEIQMISHDERGWAWTQAFLGLQAKEIHLCGEARSVPLMRELCALAGDQLQVHEYERLTPLRVANESLGGLKNLQKGDCIVAFTILGIHALRQEIERMTNRKCAIVYGSLPPETRAQQARLFNEPDNDYDFLVASDAIGMGLNLAIKRIIFESTVKSNGINLVQLQVSEVKQIAGRAGRYRTAHQAVTADNAEDAENTAVDLDDKNPNDAPSEPTVGWVTTMESVDRPHLRACMAEEPAPIKTAGIFPPSLIVERFANYFPPHTPFTYILLRLLETCDVHSRFHLCRLKDQLNIADVIQVVGNLSIQDRITICNAPLNATGQLEAPFCRELAECIASGEHGGFLDLKTLPLDFMDAPMQPGRSYLFALEQLHKMIVCYLWLSFRYPNVFTTRAVAERAKSLVEARIEESLTHFSFTKQAAEEIRRRRERARKKLDAMNEQKADSASESNANLRSPVEAQLVSQKM